ncbi:MAG: tetratricopeptide repeat protein [Cyanobacteria bacterium SZAS TMP-1]|nr:tetratricopeptide repeat protein [Cyanobacteria bacterium SZAS TMP-1]
MGCEKLLRKNGFQIIVLLAAMIGGPFIANSAPLGYFPPPRYSNYRRTGGFWSDETKPAQTLSEQQSQLIKTTVKELSKAGISKSKQSGCIQTIADAISSSGKHHAKEAPGDEAAQLENAASCCAQAGREDLAEDISHCTLKIFASQGNATSREAHTLDNLAGLSFKKGSCDRAIGFLNQALEIEKRYSFKGPSDTGLLLNHLAQCYARAGKYDESEKIMNRAILTDREKMGEDSLAVAEDHYNLGVTQYLKGDKAKAEQCVKTALEILPKISQDTTEQKNAWSKFYSIIQKESKAK